MNNVNYKIISLEKHFVENATKIIVDSHKNNDKEHPRYRYDYIEKILLDSLNPEDNNRFLIAVVDDKVVGVGGYGKALFATNTWTLMLSAVEKPFRGNGIGTTMVAARISKIQQEAESGRILVSTKKTNRFERFGFVIIDKDVDSQTFLLMKKFSL